MPSRRLTAYLAVVTALGCIALVYVLVQPDALDVLSRPAVVWPLALVMIIGELRPILIARGQADADEVSVSSTVGMALLIVAW